VPALGVVGGALAGNALGRLSVDPLAVTPQMVPQDAAANQFLSSIGIAPMGVTPQAAPQANQPVVCAVR
jgi:hypothetical protein